MKKGHILIVDDEVLILEGVKELIADFADKVFTATNGILALEILDKEQIHCVICDIKMPEMDGLGVVKNARERKIDIPFIFFTAHGTRDLMLEAAKYGIYGLVNKPNFDELVEIVPLALKQGLLTLSGKQQSTDSAMLEESLTLIKNKK